MRRILLLLILAVSVGAAVPKDADIRKLLVDRIDVRHEGVGMRNAGGVAANSRWQAAEGRAATGCCAEPLCTPNGVLDGSRDGSGTPSGGAYCQAPLSGGVALARSTTG